VLRNLESGLGIPHICKAIICQTGPIGYYTDTTWRIIRSQEIFVQLQLTIHVGFTKVFINPITSFIRRTQKLDRDEFGSGP
jgi:hypothetical protein